MPNTAAMWVDKKNRELLHQILGVGLEVDLVIALMRRCSKWYPIKQG